ncbi:MAG: 2-oxo acid dehydrogenase subunit E2, partial [Deltaproteobacteria bacterium]|nr:2-oxo acid dehydrogenase subunit E2 [Deltaproteobacteria bacterium]
DVRGALREEMAEDRPHAPLEERQPLVGMRRKIAERMHHAKATAAHFTFVEECDASRLVDLRQRLLPEAERRGVRLTFLPFIIKAVTEALRKHPVLNSELDERTNELVYKKYYNIGVATATEAGLMVPVVQNADRLRLFELAARIERLSRAAQEGTLAPEDLRNSTFTVTSLGKQGGLLATPILNHPEVGILGVHRIKEKPVVREGEIVVGKVMLLSLSLDHRIVDGHVGAAFAYDVIETLENPERSFFEYL